MKDLTENPFSGMKHKKKSGPKTIEEAMNIKKPKAIEVPSKEEIFKAGLQMFRVAKWYPFELLGLYFQMYLFGQRIKEALATKVKDYKIKKIKYKRKDVLIVILTSINLKTKKLHLKRKTIPLVIDENHKIEGKMFQFLYNQFISPKLKNGMFESFVFENLIKYKQQNINNKFKAYTLPFKLDVVLPNGEFVHGFYYMLHPHFLRHCRLSHLGDEGLDVLDLMKIAGWTTPAPATTYVKTDVNRTIKKMLGEKEE